MTRCRTCGLDEVEPLLDIGEHPVSSHFQTARAAEARRWPIGLGVCRACGVVQLRDPIPFRALVPPFPWISYREPEAHLDAVAETLAGLVTLSADKRVLGLTAKDRTLLERLAGRGASTRLIDPAVDLGESDPNANIETVHGTLDADLGRAVAARGGPYDVVLARHILEHAEDARRFMFAIDALLAPGGVAVIEVPDCRANLERQDYTMIWEEHVSYFTGETFAQLLGPVGFEPLSLEVHPYPFEDVLVLYARKGVGGAVVTGDCAPAVALARDYAAAFPAWTARLKAALDDLTQDGRKLAAYGAGHLTCAFINFHDLASYFAVVIDDTPEKQGLFLPGAQLPIAGPAALDASRISACLFGLAPQIEDRIIARNAAFIEAGGVFLSMFADSDRSIRQVMART
ncbi:class I SAM-dependent methyltransferase [Mangrovibrevibacter kandeliae]|uniref:class I SAM-dependent methyltransferase n=1 Tax=Mangrovibrevibacter kandeliae TaxID=2968473 RepID=UPI0021190261|nr:class I SAM-dependent methyltransferase [Aurantimonas sp. CSK15Z-1]MCQ8782823.1 class I SAM-dependent methyltransferase [Aurantimonas sp. CSK15Z-1]